MQIDPVPMDVVLRLRKMTREAAEALLAEYELTDQQRERYLGIAGSALPKIQLPGEGPVVIPEVQNRARNRDPSRAKFLAAAWLLGASYRQLGKLDGGVTAQAIFNIVDRVLPHNERGKRYGSEMSGEALEYYRDLFKSNEELLHDLEPHAIANWLLNHTPQGMIHE